MAKVYEFLANGFEEVEALAPVDILRRGGVEVKTISVTGNHLVESSHGVTIKADLLFEEISNFSDVDLLMLPGGMPGSKNLNEHDGVRKALKEQFESGKRVAAICAAPLVLASVGLLKGKKATIYPGMESYLGDDAEYTGALVQEDGNVTTGGGPAASFPYAYKLLSYFIPQAKVEEIKKGMIYDRLISSK
jgi:DJ-1 family protein